MGLLILMWRLILSITRSKDESGLHVTVEGQSATGCVPRYVYGYVQDIIESALVYGCDAVCNTRI